ncbi:MAG TPA: GAF domain-containing protein [Microcoleaceae cyanobacterium]|jgi:GAF domain-containing protein
MTNLTLEQIAQQVQALVNAETAVIALAESQGETVYYAAGVGKHAAAIVGKRGATATSGLCGVAFQQEQPVLVCQTQGDPRVRQDHVAALGINSALAVPLHHQGQLLGALMVLNRQDGQPFNQEQEQQLNDYAQTISSQIQPLLEQN